MKKFRQSKTVNMPAPNAVRKAYFAFKASEVNSAVKTAADGGIRINNEN
jgi:hypothetical protein